MKKGICKCGKLGHLAFTESRFLGGVDYYCSVNCMRKEKGQYIHGKNLDTQHDLCLFCGDVAELAYYTTEHPFFNYPADIYYACSGCMPGGEGLPIFDYTYRVTDIGGKVIWEGKKGQATH